LDTMRLMRHTCFIASSKRTRSITALVSLYSVFVCVEVSVCVCVCVCAAHVLHSILKKDEAHNGIGFVVLRVCAAAGKCVCEWK
jgi:hypothetical protein